jgi:riboflavin synthase
LASVGASYGEVPLSFLDMSPVPRGTGSRRSAAVFTGIVEERGEVVSFEPLGDSARLTIRGSLTTEDLRSGDSLSVDGCCLTVAEPGSTVSANGIVGFDVMAESLARTTLGSRQPGDPVNLERSVRADGRLGGHLVQGHVDGVGTVAARESTPRWDLMRIGLPADLAPYVAVKGSIAVDGVSLTVVDVGDNPDPAFTVALIPTTLARTTLGLRQVGSRVNLEVDVVAKYVRRLLSFSSNVPSNVLSPVGTDSLEGAPAWTG